MSNELHFNIIDQFFKTNSLVEHHIKSVNYFYEHELKSVLNDLNPIVYQNNYDDSTEHFKNEIKLYFGGKDCKKIYYGKPIIYEDDKKKFYSQMRLDLEICLIRFLFMLILKFL